MEKNNSEIQTGSGFLLAKGQERLFSKQVMRGKQDAATETRWMAERRELPLLSSTVNMVKTDAERKQGQEWQRKKKGRCASFYLLH